MVWSGQFQRRSGALGQHKVLFASFSVQEIGGFALRREALSARPERAERAARNLRVPGPPRGSCGRCIFGDLQALGPLQYRRRSGTGRNRPPFRRPPVPRGTLLQSPTAAASFLPGPPVPRRYHAPELDWAVGSPSLAFFRPCIGRALLPFNGLRMIDSLPDIFRPLEVLKTGSTPKETDSKEQHQQISYFWILVDLA